MKKPLVVIKLGDSRSLLPCVDADTFDSLVTDPPAGINFMSAKWDADKGGRNEWIEWMTGVMVEALRVLKPGAHGLVWALPRTSHWTATALEDAGFEIRDVVTHLFGSGFPKSLNISKAIDKAAGVDRDVLGEIVRPNGKRGGKIKSMAGNAYNDTEGRESKSLMETAPATDAAKQWDGWGTALKPASEHWILVRKPLSEKTIAANVLKHGTGGINIDGCRIDTNTNDPNNRKTPTVNSGNKSMFGVGDGPDGKGPEPQGRFPANLILSGDAPAMLDAQSGDCKTGGHKPYKQKNTDSYSGGMPDIKYYTNQASKGGASRFFYCSKASKKDRGEGNKHPTVKSSKLMEYLITMVTPPGGTVLDPFMGSGSTGVAAVSKGFGFVGIEEDIDFFKIAGKRLELDTKRSETRDTTH